MGDLLITNGLVLTPTEQRLVPLWVQGHLLAAPGSIPENADQCEVLDASGCYVTPGLVDIQVNGGPSCDFWGNPEPQELVDFMGELVASGVTSILPTLITAPVDHLVKTMDFLRGQAGVGSRQGQADFDLGKHSGLTWTSVKQSGRSGDSRHWVRMPGIHLEGPFLSPKRPGVHPPEYMQALSVEALKGVLNPDVTLMTVAPETDSKGGALEYLQERSVVPSLGHSNATYEESCKAFDGGVKLVTHLFNAMPPLHHREPGPAAAALLDERVTVCVIADGLHVNPDVVRLIIRAKGVDKVVLATDIAHVGTRDGGLVGSSIFLCQAVQNLVRWGACNFQSAVRMATYNPSRALGLSTIGDIAAGKHADLVLWDRETLAIKHVVVAGRVCF